MSSINPQIDRFVDEVMKPRAAEFDNRPGWRPMSECDDRDIPQFLARAQSNLDRARDILVGRGFPRFVSREELAAATEHLADAANLCALVHAVLPKEET